MSTSLVRISTARVDQVRRLAELQSARLGERVTMNQVLEFLIQRAFSRAFHDEPPPGFVVTRSKTSHGSACIVVEHTDLGRFCLGIEAAEALGRGLPRLADGKQKMCSVEDTTCGNTVTAHHWGRGFVLRTHPTGRESDARETTVNKALLPDIGKALFVAARAAADEPLSEA
jgi:hypothetical protein